MSGRRPLGAAAMLLAAVTLAADYPPASDPGKGPPKPPRGGTLQVCKKGCEYKKIQAAVDGARRGTTIRVGRGVYREGVRILGARKDRVKLIGDPRRPGRVVLEGRGLRGRAARNGVRIDRADGVSVNGFTARNYKDNGFFITRADGYKLTNLVADTTGAHGIHVFNSRGGEMSNSEAFYAGAAGYRVGQTPPQVRPRRTTLRNVVAWGNVTGYSGTNSRYVTITRSAFFNNGAGVVANVLATERFMPHEDNTIVGNDIFWNNFNPYAGAPFKLRRSAAGSPVPIGTGALLLGGRRTRVENNRIWGNWLVGYGQVAQFTLRRETLGLGLPERNEVRNNRFGLIDGRDPNGRDLFYDGSGGGNCFEGNSTRSRNVPADNSTFSQCGRPNSYSEAARNEAVAWLTDATNETHWLASDHAPIAGITPLERWTADYPRPRVRTVRR